MANPISGPGMRPSDAAGARRTETTRGASGSPSAQPAAAPAGETVNLTPSGRLLAKLADALQSTPVVDAERVRAAQQSIAAGTYGADAETIADKMIEHERGA